MDEAGIEQYIYREYAKSQKAKKDKEYMEKLVVKDMFELVLFLH